MAQESRGLGRGLGALLGAAPTVSASRGGGTLPLSLMQSGALQPRREIHQEPLEELAASIKAKGVIQPIIVRPLPAGASGPARYEIVAGERRWQAAKLAGLADIPVIVRDLSDQEAVAVALIENIQREELTATEEARSLKRLTTEFSLTQQEVADSVGRSRAAVSNLIRLLDLPEPLVALIDSKALGMGHARALLGLRGDAERQRLGQLVAQRGLSVRETENLVRKSLKGEGEGTATRRPPELTVVSEVLRTEAVHVQLHQHTTGSGKII
ncbi:MAG: ParB family transcriptional regulator, chromosome partitioning protein, partial [Gammaproteobacteria bacterium]|nr:ParB family transcriptional regulator, chromosome partitioning protein [Gammaproteobacteria bacterium]